MKYNDFGRRGWEVVIGNPNAYMGRSTYIVVADSMADAIAIFEKYLKNNNMKADVLEVKACCHRVL